MQLKSSYAFVNEMVKGSGWWNGRGLVTESEAAERGGVWGRQVGDNAICLRLSTDTLNVVVLFMKFFGWYHDKVAAQYSAILTVKFIMG